MRTPSRTRFLALSACVLGVLGAGVAGIASASSLDPARSSASSPALRPHWPRPTRTTPAPPSDLPSAPPAGPPSSPSSPPGDLPSSPPASPPADPPSSPPADPPSSPPADPADAVIEQVLAHINAARTAAGVPVLTLSPELTTAAEAHNALMAGGCGLSHQCPGEAGLGRRFTAAGVVWRSAGENVGQGNARDNEASIVAAANGLTDLMLAEVPPNDGHRRNLLNPGFGRTGLAVTRGTDGRVWVTQDFVN